MTVRGFSESSPQVTGIMVGEGEVTFREVLDQYLREAETAGQSEQQPESGSTEQQAADEWERLQESLWQNVSDRFRDYVLLPVIRHPET